VAGYADPERDRWSDAVCTALQLTNFWQDLARDWDKGRLYVPQELARPIGAREEDLARGVLTPSWREALADCARRTRALFDDLVSAFGQDITTTRYASWPAVLDYCRRSANPVGRLVLRVAGYADPERDRWSDAVCTALQLTNFWQDLARDWDKGRLYVPQEIARPIGAREEDLARGVLTPRWREALAECARRTRALFDAGRPVCDSVAGRLRWELRATWLGGTRILERVARAEYDVVHQRPSLSFADAPVLLWRLARWHRDGSAAGG
jgi:phytoene/squalene synthetase